MEPIPLASFACLSTTLGGIFSLRNQKYISYIISFTAGVLLAVSFLDILPELVRISATYAIPIDYGFVCVLIGYMLIHVIEKYIVIHISHENEYASHHHPSVGVVSTFGLIFHSFLDGVGIGLGFHINPHVGLLVAFAVVAHDFSDGINSVSLMLINENTKFKTKVFLFLDAIAPIVGAASTLFISIPTKLLFVYLGLFAGFLLYIGASDLLPEAHSNHSSFKKIGLTFLGLFFIFLVTRVV